MSSWLLPIAERAARAALNLQGFESRIVETSVASMHVYDAVGAGNLPTTVVLHGIGSAATPFGGLLTRLRAHTQRVIAPDLPGHGFSAAPRQSMSPDTLFGAVREALDPIAERPFVVFGNSLGGALALRYAIEHPERVRALVLVSPAGAQMTPDEWQTLTDRFRVHTSHDARRLLERLYHRMPFYMPAFASGLRDSLQRRVVQDVLRAASTAVMPSPEQLAALRMPVLLLWGASERIFPPSSLEYFKRHLPRHALIEEPARFGHCPHIDDPARLSRRVVEFLSTGSSR